MNSPCFCWLHSKLWASTIKYSVIDCNFFGVTKKVPIRNHQQKLGRKLDTDLENPYFSKEIIVTYRKVSTIKGVDNKSFISYMYDPTNTITRSKCCYCPRVVYHSTMIITMFYFLKSSQIYRVTRLVGFSVALSNSSLFWGILRDKKLPVCCCFWYLLIKHPFLVSNINIHFLLPQNQKIGARDHVKLLFWCEITVLYNAYFELILWFPFYRAKIFEWKYLVNWIFSLYESFQVDIF